MPRHLLRYLLATFILLTPVVDTAAADHPPLSFSMVLDMTTLAFAGTVKSVLGRSIDGVIVSDIEFTDVVLARGENEGPSLVITERGGTFGDMMTVSVDLPQFEIGQRYVVLSYGRGAAADWYMPIVAFPNGLFRIRTNQSTRERFVVDYEGRDIAAIRNDHLVLLQLPSKKASLSGEEDEISSVFGPIDHKGRSSIAYEIYPRRKDPGSRVSEEQFLEEVRRHRRK